MPYDPPSADYVKQQDTVVPVTSTPAIQGVDHNGIVVGKWRDGLFSCTSNMVPNACMTLVCPAISLAQITARLGLLRFYAVLSVFVVIYLFGILAASLDTPAIHWIFGIMVLLCVIFMWWLRTRVRFLFSIPGSPYEDCAVATCCGCCSIAQMATHVESYTPGACAFAPRQTLEGYAFA